MKEEPTYARILLQALRRPGYRRAAISTGALYFMLYLYAVGHLILNPDVVSPRGTPAFVLDPGWAAKVLDPIAGYTFEPVAAFYPFEGFTVLIAPLNVLIGATLGGLIALNVASALYALATARSCRRFSWTGLLGSLPGLLTGFACCVPTVGLVLGTNLVLALVGLQGILLPASVVALVGGVLWNVRRTRKELPRVAPESL